MTSARRILPGGIGLGLATMVLMALLAVFVAGRMVGRTPEYLGKKIEAREIKLALLALFVFPVSLLGFAAVAAVLSPALEGLLNKGPHGLSDILHAYTSANANSGSAFAVLTANTPWWDTTLGIAMLVGRFVPAVAIFAVVFTNFAESVRGALHRHQADRHGHRRPRSCLKSKHAMGTFMLLAALFAAPAMAQDVVPTASTSDAPICTDRPTKSNFACTVPKGMVQIEADTFNWLRTTAAGVRTDQLLFTNPTFKYGLSDSSDIQLNGVPFTQVRTRDASGNVASVSGLGDMTVRFKQRLTPLEGAFQLAILPFAKLPTARIGNGNVEGGVAVPINYSVPGGWTITLGPQLDVLADFDGRGRHLGVTGLVNIAKQFGQFTLYNEIWTNQNFDPAGTVRQYSYDVALAWLPHPTLQIDVGVNIGLNRNTPDVVSYIGISTRF